MPDHYRLYLPFEILGEHELRKLPHTSMFGNYQIEVVEARPGYAIWVDRIPTEQKALALIDRLKEALHWVAIDQRMGIVVSGELQSAYRPKDPWQTPMAAFGNATRRRVDAAIDGSRAAVVRSGDEVFGITGQPCNLVFSHCPERVVESLNEGRNVVAMGGAPTAANVKLAIELYCHSHAQYDAAAKFLVLCTALEAISPSGRLSARSIALIDTWIAASRAESQSLEAGSFERLEIEKLLSRVGNLKNQSHTDRIGCYVAAVLSGDGNQEADMIGREVRDLYRKRGALLHEGNTDVDDELSRLDEIVRMVLKAALRQPQLDQ